MMGGKEAHEYMYLTPVGEDTLMFCDSCDYSANRQVASFAKPHPAAEDLLPLEKSPRRKSARSPNCLNFWRFPLPKQPRLSS